MVPCSSVIVSAISCLPSSTTFAVPWRVAVRAVLSCVASVSRSILQSSSFTGAVPYLSYLPGLSRHLGAEEHRQFNILVMIRRTMDGIVSNKVDTPPSRVTSCMSMLDLPSEPFVEDGREAHYFPDVTMKIWGSWATWISSQVRRGTAEKAKKKKKKKKTR
ncbi:hypothetical protein F4778DRAFT_266559 [Xylariomycetidae sp. FL2044]|nr:hypothetical protein F4778DRAFT_266559 [Xylariomycetidae sp. FL2044]